MKAQTSLEYMVVLAAVIMVASVAVYIISSSTDQNHRAVLIHSCQEAASQCLVIKSSNPNAVCPLCDRNCIDPATGFDLVTGVAPVPSDDKGAVGCCKAGNYSAVYYGSAEQC